MATKTSAKKPTGKTVATKKQKKNAQDKRTTNMVIGIVGLIFLAAIIYLTTTMSTTSSTSGGHSSEIETALASGPMATVLKENGIQRPLYEADKPHKIIVYIDPSWSSISHDEQVKRTNKIGEAWQNLVTQHFGKQTDTEVMVHTPQDQMIGTWYPSEGGKIQQ